MVRRMSPTLDLLKRASWRAEVLFKQRGSFRTIVWLTEDAGGHRAQFETACSAPVEVSNAAALESLAAEMAADFARDRVKAFAVAYPATAHTPVGRCSSVCIEAHGSDDLHLCGLREIVRLNGRASVLGGLTLTSAGNCRYVGLLCVTA
jgi:hypothetical protein